MAPSGGRPTARPPTSSPPRRSAAAPRRSPLVSLAAAVARNGVIGVENRLPWRLPDDLRRFRALTWGKPIVMGRRTHESIGRPLPGRRNVVVTRRGPVMEGCERADSLAAALALTAAAPETVVIGGARCYREALPIAARLYLTRIEADFEGDTWFPAWDPGAWIERERECVPAGAPLPFGYAFVVLERQSTERVSPD